ncbi:MAG: Rne/Rng family ribonuclease [Candidatus Melainabacteria bacterium]|nr:Rne/Rng family ribonuclease [Candidatus Melainabacteria bacterium]
MRKSIVISEQDNIAALLENDRVVEFFVNRGELLLGDIYTASVENILPGIDAAFVNLGKDKMGFLHANDVPGQGPLKERLVPKQKLLVQITKEPTGHKGPRVSTAISLPGRFLVLVPEERGVSISRRISEARERARLKSVVNLMKPPGVGLIIRTEAKGQGDQELFEDFEQLWDRWQTIVSEAEASIGPTLIYRDQDLLFRVIRDAYSHEVSEIIADSPEGQRRAQEYLSGWASKQTKVSFHTDEVPLLLAKGIDREIEAALSDRAELPSGGHLNVQPTEALTVIDVNSGRFTSSRTQAETVRRTNLEAAQEIPRQLRLRNIGGMVIVDFIDMDSRKDQQQVLEAFQRALEEDRAKPQIGQLSDLGLVELTRRRQGQSLRELFSIKCQSCVGQGVIPQLELGPPEDRRIIAFKNRDEENRRGKSRGGSGRGGNQPLKAASAVSGRVMPSRDSRDIGFSNDSDRSHSHDSHDESADHGHEFDDVPEEILAQMPEDLLDARASGKVPGKRVNFDGDDYEGHEGQSGSGNGDDEHDTGSLIVKRPHLTDEDDDEFADDEQDMAADLARSVSAVESVYQEMDSHSGAHIEIDKVVEATIITNDFLEPVELGESAEAEEGEHAQFRHNQAEAAVEVEAIAETSEHQTAYEGSGSGSGEHHSEHSEFEHQHDAASNGHNEEAAVSVAEEIPETPIAAEVDPVTGIYRLKTKAEQEEADRQQTAHEQANDSSDLASDSHGSWLNSTEPALFSSEDEAAPVGDFSQLRIPIASTASVSDSPSGEEEGDRSSTEYSGDDFRHEQE